MHLFMPEPATPSVAAKVMLKAGWGIVTLSAVPVAAASTAMLVTDEASLHSQYRLSREGHPAAIERHWDPPRSS